MEHNQVIDEALLQRVCAMLHLTLDRIKLHESFVRNGGDSLLAVRFSNVIRKSEQLYVGAGAILREKRLGDLLDKAELRKLASGPVSQSKYQISNEELTKAALPDKNDIEDKTLDPIQRFPKVIPTVGLPITFIQAATAHYTHLIPGAAVQHITQYCYTDVLPRLKDAFTKAMSSYQVMRLSFKVVLNPLLVEASLKHCFHLNWQESESESFNAANLEQSFREWGIEASTEPVFRVLTPSDTSSTPKLSVVHWFYHLSMLDGRSMDILLRHVDALMDDPSTLPNVVDDNFDVVKALTEYQKQHSAAPKAFWAVHEVPAESRNHPLLHALGDRKPSIVRMRAIDVFYPEDVKAFQSRTGHTFEILVRAALALVLCKLQDTTTVSLMSVSSRRSLPIPGIEDTVGSLASSMILTIDINENDTARDLLEQVFHKVIELEEMSYSDPSDGFSLGGLVVVSSDLQPHVPWYSAGKQTEIMSPKETLPTLYVGSNGRVRFCYNSEWRTPDEMQIMADLLETALSDLGLGIHGVGKCLSEMPNKTQRKAIAEWGNCHSRNQMLDKTEVDIVSLFQKQVDLRGDAAALRFRGRDVSYGTLSNMIIITGHQLRKLLKPGSVVMLHADGSVNWVVAMFAILWADCVFSPQGATLPHAVRTQHYAIAKAEAFLVPCSGSCVQTPDGCQLRLCVETIVNTSSTGHPLTTRLATPLSPAYICFSSGTTGHPKAILCTHSGVIALLRDPIARLHVAPGHLVAQSLAPQFDGALLEVFSALCYGGTLVLKDPLNPFEHLRHVDSLMLTPSLAEELSPEEYVNDVKYVYMAGEVLPQSTADRWAVGTAEVWNVYGPTETHILATAQRVVAGQPVTIGKPLLSTRVYILDKKGSLTPPLVAGEIFIGGVSVSRGYLGLEDENALRFVEDTIRPGSDGGRMYRTGDWGYWTLDGEIGFIGRTDRQVKVGGFRVDLNDVQARVQAVIGSQGKVKVAVVMVGDVLGCMVEETQAGRMTADEIREVIEQALPAHMMPKIFRCVGKMPVSSVGKMDLKAVAFLLGS